MFKQLVALTGLPAAWVSLIIGTVFCSALIALLYCFFGTEIGSAIRATGSNEHMVRSLGVNTNFTKVLGLMVGNALIALSGALVTQSQGYADIKMGTGAIVIGLASIIIGEVLFSGKKRMAFGTKLFSVILGSVIYRIIVALVLQMGLNTDDLKLLTAILVAVALAVPVAIDKRRQVQSYKASLGKEDDGHAGN